MRELVYLFNEITANIAHAAVVLPNIPIFAELWDLCSHNEILLYTRDSIEQIAQVRQYLFNPNPLSADEIWPIIDDFQEANELTSWDDLTLEDRSAEFIDINMRNLRHLRYTTSHRNRILDELIRFHLRNNTLSRPENRYLRNFINSGGRRW